MSNFSAFAAQHGLLIRDLIADGRVHRVPTEDHPKKRNGAYSFDGVSGFVQNWATHPRAIAFQHRDRILGEPAGDRLMLANIRRQRMEDERLMRAEVAKQARALLNRCTYTTHPYLARKGFPAAQGLVDPEGWLVVPMRPASRYTGLISSVQRIAEDGTKRFLKDGATKGCVYIIGPSIAPRIWLCEGLATGMSVHAALNAMYRQDRVAVCFSAHNLTHVANAYGLDAVVMADNDESGTGEAAARATGLRWAMPDEVGIDWNDVHCRDGLIAVRRGIERVLK